MPPEDRTNHSSAADEAADWYARLRAQDVTEIDGLRFRAWLSGPPERRREFEALERLWQGASPLEQSPAMQRTRELILARRRKAARPRTRHIWAIAAMILLTMTLVVWYWLEPRSDALVTDVGELRSIPLSDGSVVTLNTATEVRLLYSNAERRMELLKGQANFEVARDAARPFIVKVGDREVRALGTVFDVYKGTDKVTVTLLEGKVAVSAVPHGSGPFGAPEPTSSAEPAPLVLQPGEQVSYVPTTPVATVAPTKIAAVDVPRVTAWKARKLAFRDTLLTEAIAEANRYSREQIVLEAPGMAAARLSGSFEAGKNDLFAEGLRTFFGLRMEHRDDGRIVLTQPTQ